MTKIKTASLYRKYFNPQVISTIEGLELRARLVVEGFISGKHKSPNHGFNVEFSQHREYEPGDEIRNIDWRVWARTDRYYIKQFEEETNLKAMIVLDCSKSMHCQSKQSVSKFHYGQLMTAALAYLLLHQQDAIGLTLFDEKMSEYLPPRSNPAQLKNILSLLDSKKPGTNTDISSVLHSLAERLSRRNVIILISDMYSVPSEIYGALQHLRYKKHEIILFHIMDVCEETFPFNGQVQFTDSETGEILLTNAGAIREQYLNEIANFSNELKRKCGQMHIDYIYAATNQPYSKTLKDFLIRRKT